MKKISILGVCALIGLGAAAQETVLKDAEKLMKKGATLTEVEAAVKPAMSDAATQNEAMTYYLPGKAGFNEYDNGVAKEALGQLSDEEKVGRAKALLQGYNYMMKALPLDSVVDEKGKVKTKYSKDIINTVGGHFNDYYSAGAELYNGKDFAGAYDLWGAYAALPSMPTFAKAIPVMPSDTVVAEVMFNQGLAAWQGDDFNGALKAFMNAKNHGYTKKNVYDYGIAVATQAGNDAAVNELATEAQAKYGDEDPNYIGYIINGYIKNKQYQQAIDAIDQAIAANPTNSQYHVIKGILYEQDEIGKDAMPEYEKAVELDSHNASALYQLGRMYNNKALNIYNDAPNDNAEFNRVFNEEFKPVMLQAVDLFERSLAIDEDNIDALKLLENAYYLLNDDANLNATKARLGGN
ncbi:MAG: hypothetical protein LIP09_00030 [Bacteroidales bacterium]|nr:hypothetical protein [Bacteroidales bacterium]